MLYRELGKGPDDILITLETAIFRRGLGVLAFAALGAILFWLGATTSGNLVGRSLMLVSGATVLYYAARLWQISDVVLELTRTELREAGGRCLAKVDNISAVERSTFAFKPSNGFLVRLKDPVPRGWVPGIWWRFGRNVGVGGMTNVGQSKAMAEILTVVLADRDRKDANGQH